jgi:hypothetical protein
MTMFHSAVLLMISTLVVAGFCLAGLVQWVMW